MITNVLLKNFLKEITLLRILAFKAKMKRWKPICSCRICRIYIERVGFIWFLNVYTHIFIYLYSIYLQISIKMQKVSHRVEMSDYPGEIDGVQLFYFGYFGNHPANIDFLESSSRSTRKRCEICSKLAIKTPEMTTFSCFFC